MTVSLGAYNQIVHEADIDLMIGSIQSIIHRDVQVSINHIETLGNCIYSLI